MHITSDEALSWNRIYEILAGALGVELNPVHIATDFLVACQDEYDLNGNLHGDKCANVLFDNTKIKRLVPDFLCAPCPWPKDPAGGGIHVRPPECQEPDPVFDRWCDRVCAAYQAGLAAFQA